MGSISSVTPVVHDLNMLITLRFGYFVASLRVQPGNKIAKILGAARGLHGRRTVPSPAPVRDRAR